MNRPIILDTGQLDRVSFSYGNEKQFPFNNNNVLVGPVSSNKDLEYFEDMLQNNYAVYSVTTKTGGSLTKQYQHGFVLVTSQDNITKFNTGGDHEAEQHCDDEEREEV